MQSLQAANQRAKSFHSGFASGNTEVVLEMINRLFNRYSNFVGGILFLCTADGTGASTQVFLRVNIKYPAAGRFCTRVFKIAETFAFLVSLLYTQFILGHTNLMVGSPQRRWDLFPSCFIGREESLEQQGMPFSLRGQSLSGREILPLSGIYAFSTEVFINFDEIESSISKKNFRIDKGMFLKEVL